MIELPTDLPAELVPLSWLIGVWEGTGVIEYATDDDRTQLEFGQRIAFSHDGLGYLNYSATSWVLDEGQTPLAAETGYWRLSRQLVEGDAGPAMLPGVGSRPFGTAQSVETLRNSNGAFDLDVTIIHPDGVSEIYVGQVAGPRIDLVTDAVIRTAGAKEYTAATRLYGLVESHLLWAWDIAALGHDLRTHASARLAKVD